MKNHDNILPYWSISSVDDIGRLVRDQRKSQSATQAEFAALCGVGVRFISDLENGKPTMELGKVLHILHCLGLEITITPRGWRRPSQTPFEERAGSVKGDNP